jgi:hypothetical protein
VKSRRAVAALTACAFAFAFARPASASTLDLRSDQPGAKIEQLAGTAELQVGSKSGTAEIWTDLCSAPCGIAAPAGVPLRVSGPGIETSAPFVPQAGSDLTVSVKAGSEEKRNLGAGLALTGIAAALIGGATLVGSSQLAGAESLGGSPASGSNVVSAVGVGMLIAGGLGLLVGIPLFAANRTEVSFQ